jgi:hypothetical protein
MTFDQDFENPDTIYLNCGLRRTALSQLGAVLNQKPRNFQQRKLRSNGQVTSWRYLSSDIGVWIGAFLK